MVGQPMNSPPSHFKRNIHDDYHTSHRPHNAAFERPSMYQETPRPLRSDAQSSSFGTIDNLMAFQRGRYPSHSYAESSNPYHSPDYIDKPPQSHTPSSTHRPNHGIPRAPTTGNDTEPTLIHG